MPQRPRRRLATLSLISHPIQLSAEAEDAPGQHRIDVGKTLLIGIVGSVIPIVGNVVSGLALDVGAR